jgi:uncharacterized membrane protein
MNTKQFTTERINNFTDAIFAIAITLLILDIKVPPADQINQQGAVGALFKNQTPQIIGMVVSFFVAALFWKAHLSLAKNISSYDSKLIWLNTLLLFFVVIMPFSTAFYSRNFSYDSAFHFYCINVACIGVMNFWMISHSIKKENLLDKFTSTELKWMKLRSLIVPFVFILSVLVSYLSPLLGRLTFILIFVFQGIGEVIVKRKAAKTEVPSEG